MGPASSGAVQTQQLNPHSSGRGGSVVFPMEIESLPRLPARKWQENGREKEDCGWVEAGEEERGEGAT